KPNVAFARWYSLSDVSSASAASAMRPAVCRASAILALAPARALRRPRPLQIALTIPDRYDRPLAASPHLQVRYMVESTEAPATAEQPSVSAPDAGAARVQTSGDNEVSTYLEIAKAREPGQVLTPA